MGFMVGVVVVFKSLAVVGTVTNRADDAHWCRWNTVEFPLAVYGKNGGGKVVLLNESSEKKVTVNTVGNCTKPACARECEKLEEDYIPVIRGLSTKQRNIIRCFKNNEFTEQTFVQKRMLRWYFDNQIESSGVELKLIHNKTSKCGMSCVFVRVKSLRRKFNFKIVDKINRCYLMDRAPSDVQTVLDSLGIVSKFEANVLKLLLQQFPTKDTFKKSGKLFVVHNKHNANVTQFVFTLSKKHDLEITRPNFMVVDGATEYIPSEKTMELLGIQPGLFMFDGYTYFHLLISNVYVNTEFSIVQLDIQKHNPGKSQNVIAFYNELLALYNIKSYDNKIIILKLYAKQATEAQKVVHNSMASVFPIKQPTSSTGLFNVSKHFPMVAAMGLLFETKKLFIMQLEAKDFLERYMRNGDVFASTAIAIIMYAFNNDPERFIRNYGGVTTLFECRQGDKNIVYYELRIGKDESNYYFTFLSGTTMVADAAEGLMVDPSVYYIPMPYSTTYHTNLESMTSKAYKLRLDCLVGFIGKITVHYLKQRNLLQQRDQQIAERFADHSVHILSKKAKENENRYKIPENGFMIFVGGNNFPPKWRTKQCRVGQKAYPFPFFVK